MMRNSRRFSVLALLVAAIVASAAFLPVTAQDKDDTDTRIAGSLDDEGLALSFEISDDEKEAVPAEESPGAATTGGDAATGGSGAWYENPVMIAVLAVGALVLVALGVLLSRGGTQKSATA